MEREIKFKTCIKYGLGKDDLNNDVIHDDLLGLESKLQVIIEEYYKTCIKYGLGKDDIETNMIMILDDATGGKIELCR